MRRFSPQQDHFGLGRSSLLFGRGKLASIFGAAVPIKLLLATSLPFCSYLPNDNI